MRILRTVLIAAVIGLILVMLRYAVGVHYFKKAVTAETVEQRIEVLEKASHYGNSGANILLAQLYADRGRREEALAMLDKAADAAPTYPVTYIIRAEILTALGRQPEAVASADRALSLLPAFVAKEVTGSDAVTKAAAKHGLTPETVAARLFSRAYTVRAAANRAQKKYADAIADISAAYEKNPFDMTLLAMRADIFDEIGSREQAKKDRQTIAKFLSQSNTIERNVAAKIAEAENPAPKKAKAAHKHAKAKKTAAHKRH